MAMTVKSTPGGHFRKAVEEEFPLQVVGAPNAYCALLAERAGFRAVYLSGAGVANASFGLPDLGLTSLNDVVADIRRITAITELPLLVDADTGWSDTSTIGHTVDEINLAGAAGLHIEDQVEAKRCGHRPGKALVQADQMVDRIRAAVDARSDPDFVIMARTDAHAVEGLDSAIDRSLQYVQAGADMIFAEALGSLDEYSRFTHEVPAPILANLTEFGKTPLFTTEELRRVGIRLVLYPLSAFRAMNAAAQKIYATLRDAGTQKSVVEMMQTRDELYEILNYHEYEEKLDSIFQEENQ